MRPQDLDRSFFASTLERSDGPKPPVFADLWRTFLSLCQERLADGDDDRLLYETWTEADTLHVAFTRQISEREPDGVYGGTHHLTCESCFGNRERQPDVGDQQIWGSPGDRLARRWADEVEQSPGFSVLIAVPGPATYVVDSGMG